MISYDFILNFFLPFVLFFAISYGLLRKMKIFEENINRVIAFCLAFIASYFLYVSSLNQILPLLGYLIVAIFVVSFGAVIFLRSYGKVKEQYEKIKKPEEKKYIHFQL